MKPAAKTETEPATTPQSAEEAERRAKYAEILRRIEAGDTSVVSEVYWIQMFDALARPR
jgi:hypothetical protein